MPEVLTAAFDPVKRESTGDKVRTAIRDAILSGRLKLGQRLTEAELTAQFRVSRAVVREALQQLAYEQLIELTSYRGAQVIDLTPEQIDEIIGLRLLLEPEAVRLAKQALTEDGKASLREAARALEEERGHVQPFSRLDFAYHQLLWRLSGNVSLVKHLVLLTAPVFSMGVIMRRRSILGGRGRSTRGAGDHLQLTDRICEGSLEEAVAAIREHITENWDQTRAAVATVPEHRGAGKIL